MNFYFYCIVFSLSLLLSISSLSALNFHSDPIDHDLDVPCGGNMFKPQKFCQVFPCSWSNDITNFAYGKMIFECLYVPIDLSEGSTGFQLSYTMTPSAKYPDVSDDTYTIPNYSVTLWESSQVSKSQFNDPQSDASTFYSTLFSDRESDIGLSPCLNNIGVGDGCYNNVGSVQTFTKSFPHQTSGALQTTNNYQLLVTKEPDNKNTQCLSFTGLQIDFIAETTA